MSFLDNLDALRPSLGAIVVVIIFWLAFKYLPKFRGPHDRDPHSPFG